MAWLLTPNQKNKDGDIFDKIYFDMDGVLVDFDGGVRELAGVEPVSQENRTEEEDNRMWEAVQKVERFYYKLKPIAGMQEVFTKLSILRKDNVEILTGIPKPKRNMPSSGDDKKAWVRENLDSYEKMKELKKLLEDESTVKVNIVYKEDKKNYVNGKGTLLIDDSEKNIKLWEEAGGKGFLFTEEYRKDPKKLEEDIYKYLEENNWLYRGITN